MSAPRLVLVVLLVLGAACHGDDAEKPDAGRAADAAAANGNATLSALVVGAGELEPPFEPEVTAYDLRLPLATESTWFSATAAVESGTSITLAGFAAASGIPQDIALLAGTQDLDIVVEAADGTTAQYRVHVHRGEPTITLSYAGAAFTNPLTPGFDPATQAYAVDVGLWAQRVQLTVVPVVAGSAITVAGAPVTGGVPSQVVPLNLGLTSIQVVVTPPSGTAIAYTLSVSRAAAALQRAYVKASHPGPGGLGTSIAISGDTIVVGAPSERSAATGVDGDPTDASLFYAGAAYVFVRSGATWTQQAYLKASNTSSSDYFGTAVAISGDTIAVGAHYESSGATGINGNQADTSAPSSGAVYVFTRTGTTWTQQAYLKASNTASTTYFGEAVAAWGDTIAVGSAREASVATGIDGDQTDVSAPSAGAVYVFRRSGTTWHQEAYVKASNTDEYDWFGRAVALCNDTLVVGAEGEDSNATGVGGNEANDSVETSGAAYVFTRSGTTWSQQGYLKASTALVYAALGTSIAIAGDTVAVGALAEDQYRGAVYLFTRAGNTWTPQTRFQATNDPGDYFGEVALWGDTLVVGAHREASAAVGIGGNPADNSASLAGAAFVYSRSGTVWSEPVYVKASNTNAGDQFGIGVAVWGDTVVIGASGEASGVGGDQADNSVGNAGALYVFR